MKTRASCELQYAFEGGTWVSMAPPVRSDAPLVGFVPGLLYSVRVRTATNAGLSDFSEPITFRAVRRSEGRGRFSARVAPPRL